LHDICVGEGGLAGGEFGIVVVLGVFEVLDYGFTEGLEEDGC